MQVFKYLILVGSHDDESCSSLCCSAQYFPCTVRECEHLIIMCLLYLAIISRYYDGLGYLEAYYLDNDFFAQAYLPNFELHYVLYY
jgi:hypothetical protein